MSFQNYGSFVITASLLVMLAACLSIPQVRQAVILRCMDALAWLIYKLQWFERKDAELRKKLKELEDEDESNKP